MLVDATTLAAPALLFGGDAFLLPNSNKIKIIEFVRTIIQKLS